MPGIRLELQFHYLRVRRQATADAGFQYKPGCMYWEATEKLSYLYTMELPTNTASTYTGGDTNGRRDPRHGASSVSSSLHHFIIFPSFISTTIHRRCSHTTVGSHQFVASCRGLERILDVTFQNESNLNFCALRTAPKCVVARTFPRETSFAQPPLQSGFVIHAQSRDLHTRKLKQQC